MTYHVELAESPPRTVLELRRTVRADHAGDDIGAGMQVLYEMVSRIGLVPAGPPSTTYHGDFRPGSATEADFGIPVTAGPHDGGATSRLTVRRTEPMRYAHTTHRGDYHHIGAAYHALEDWIRDSDYEPAGPPTEVYLVAPDQAVHPDDLLTEIRIPVTAAQLAVRVDTPFDDTVRAVREALGKQGFGVLTEIDVRATLAAKLGVEMEDYLILGACNPPIAHRALQVDRRIGLLLPCNVVVRADDAGCVVEAVDPGLLVRDSGSAPELAPIAHEARIRLAAALAAIERRSTTTDA